VPGMSKVFMPDAARRERSSGERGGGK